MIRMSAVDRDTNSSAADQASGSIGDCTSDNRIGFDPDARISEIITRCCDFTSVVDRDIELTQNIRASEIGRIVIGQIAIGFKAAAFSAARIARVAVKVDRIRINDAAIIAIRLYRASGLVRDDCTRFIVDRDKARFEVRINTNCRTAETSDGSAVGDDDRSAVSLAVNVDYALIGNANTFDNAIIGDDCAIALGENDTVHTLQQASCGDVDDVIVFGIVEEDRDVLVIRIEVNQLSSDIDRCVVLAAIKADV